MNPYHNFKNLSTFPGHVCSYFLALMDCAYYKIYKIKCQR